MSATAPIPFSERRQMHRREEDEQEQRRVPTPDQFVDVVVPGVRINCGCGFKASTLGEGVAHAKSTAHTLSVTGEIRPTLRG